MIFHTKHKAANRLAQFLHLIICGLFALALLGNVDDLKSFAAHQPTNKRHFLMKESQTYERFKE